MTKNVKKNVSVKQVIWAVVDLESGNVVCTTARRKDAREFRNQSGPYQSDLKLARFSLDKFVR